MVVGSKPNHGSSSMKYSKHNIQQNKQTKKKKKLNYTFKLKAVNLHSKLVTRFHHKSLGIFQTKNILDNI